ncbi:MAG: hypothetical protein AVDCRST_MAG90-96 [uncultured Microvirga sp.]|uniref:DUF4440 domain-containing protein n=1 Tax=uncultured Microvirga sp. TaxID=412392 RepID=A0A6J4KKA3_9HYPH|nr:MAG: hypothetical protein AVDCRST_MAG90-96 [uncultured Microvirga sp.]
MNLIQADLIAAFRARDPARIAGFYAVDSVFVTPGRPPVIGRQAVAEVMVEDLTDPSFNLELTEQTSRMAASGDLAYSRGTFTASFTNPQTGQVQSIGGTYLQVLGKREDGSWEILEDISSPGPPSGDA